MILSYLKNVSGCELSTKIIMLNSLETFSDTANLGPNGSKSCKIVAYFVRVLFLLQASS